VSAVSPDASVPGRVYACRSLVGRRTGNRRRGVDEASDTLLLGECKWTAEAVGSELLRQLEALEGEVRWHGSDWSVVYALFVKHRGILIDRL
jgi:hypothetical protein